MIAKTLVEHQLWSNDIVLDKSPLHGLTALHVTALDESMTEIMEVILSQESSRDCHLEYFLHPLHAAVVGRNYQGLNALIRHYSEVTASCSNFSASSTLLTSILNHATTKYFKFRGLKINSGSTGLHIAAYQGDEVALLTLLEHGADVNVQDVDCVTPLHLAALFGWSSIVKTLLAHGANPKRRNSLHQTPALFAAANWSLPELNLGTCGAGLSDYDIKGHSLLHYALEGSQSLAMVLRNEQGSPPNGSNTSALENAWQYTVPTTGWTAEHPRLFVEALQYASPEQLGNICPDLPRTPLAIAALSGDSELVSLLLQKGWSANVTASGIENPLIAASTGGRLNMFKFLIRYAGAKGISYNPTLPGVFHASQYFPEFQTWILSEQYTEQWRLCNIASTPGARYCFWSGLERKEVPLTGHYGRCCQETMLEYAIRLRKMHKELMGRIICWEPGKPHPFLAPEELLATS